MENEKYLESLNFNNVYDLIITFCAHWRQGTLILKTNILELLTNLSGVC